MWRYVAGGGAALAIVLAGALWVGGHAAPPSVLPPMPAVAQSASDPAPPADTIPEATPATREQKRFGRYDKDRDGSVTRDEYLAARHKAFAKLDVNGDGRLDFDEWSIKATTRFAAADRDKSGAMNAAEFATTAVKRTTPVRPKCPPAARMEDEG